MPKQYLCDICGLPVTDRDGALHEIEELSSIFGDMRGFAVYRWNEEAADSGQLGIVHKACVPLQVEKYLKKFKWGRIERAGGRSKIVSRRLTA